jgi:Ca-activated chloride channel family protein
VQHSKKLISLLLFALLAGAWVAAGQSTQPSVRIIEPGQAEYVSGEIVIRAEVTPAPDTDITLVTFYVDDEVVGTREEEPWEVRWDAGVDFRRRLIRVEATDSAGGTAEDTVITRDLETAVFRAEVDRVLLNVTVVDGAGRLVPGLEINDFEVFEDGEPQAILSFTADPRPLVVGLLIDTSGSMQGPKMERAKQGAIAFLDQLGPEDEAFIMAFDAFPRVVQDLTSDRRLLREAIQQLQPAGATSLNMAVVDASDVLSERPERRALVVLSDGFDTVQTVSERQAVDYAQRQDVRLYTIGIFEMIAAQPGFGRGFDNVNRGEVTLRSFADSTGGDSVILASLGELIDAYEKIAAELRSQYAMAYQSSDPPQPGEWREIEVKADGGEARTKPGYYGGHQ